MSKIEQADRYLRDNGWTCQSVSGDAGWIDPLSNKKQYTETKTLPNGEQVTQLTVPTSSAPYTRDKAYMTQVQRDRAAGKTPPDLSEPPPVGKQSMKATINARMFDVMGTEPEAAGWTCKQWSIRLRCSEAAIVKTNVWKSMKLNKEMDKAERASKKARDKRRK